MSLAVSHSALEPAREEFKRKLGQAIELKNQKRYSEAAQILEELRESHPESASVHGLLGHALWEQHDTVRAVQSFRKAVTLSPESELASLGLFHTLMETGEKTSAFREMNRFRRVADSQEYEAISQEFGGNNVPKSRYVYVDNASVFIEGQRVSAVAKGMAIDIGDAINRRVFDFGWRLELGKLHQVLFGNQCETGHTEIWGAPLPHDSLWTMAKSKNWQVRTHEQICGKENHVDAAMAYQIAKSAGRIEKATSEIIVVTGDGDFAPVVQDLIADGFNVTVAFWRHAAIELREAAPFVPLDQWLNNLRFPSEHAPQTA